MALRQALFTTTVVGAALLQSSILTEAAPSPPAPCGTLVRKERLVCFAINFLALGAKCLQGNDP